MPADPTNAQVSARAHAIWLRRGGGPGRALDDWLQAERELRDEQSRAAKFSATSSFAPPPAAVTPHGAPPPRPAAAPTGSFAPPLPAAKAPAAPTAPARKPSKPSGKDGGRRKGRR